MFDKSLFLHCLIFYSVDIGIKSLCVIHYFSPEVFRFYLLSSDNAHAHVHTHVHGHIPCVARVHTIPCLALLPSPRAATSTTTASTTASHAHMLAHAHTSYPVVSSKLILCFASFTQLFFINIQVAQRRTTSKPRQTRYESPHTNSNFSISIFLSFFS